VTSLLDWSDTGLRDSDLQPGEMRAVVIDGVDVAVARTESGAYAAFDQWCSHEECPLADGDLEGDRVLCYCHSSEFDVWTGEALRGPATEPIQVFETAIVDGRIHVRAPGSAEPAE